MSSKQLSAKVSLDNYDLVQGIRAELSASSLGAAMDHVINFYRENIDQAPAPRSAPQAAPVAAPTAAPSMEKVLKQLREDDKYFVVKIHPRAMERVNKLREDYFTSKSFEDPQILNHFALLHQKEEAGAALLIALPEALQTRLEKRARRDIDAGKFANKAQFITQFLLAKI